jgi:hypothetical protein
MLVSSLQMGISGFLESAHALLPGNTAAEHPHLRGTGEAKATRCTALWISDARPPTRRLSSGVVTPQTPDILHPYEFMFYSTTC